MLEKLRRDELKNKLLVSNLKKKMFLGYTKLKNSLKKKRNEKYTLYDPSKEYLPFEYEYQTMYKEKYLKKLKGPKLLDLSIIKASMNSKDEKTISNKLLITENQKTLRIKHNKTESDYSSNKIVLKKIFKNEDKKIYNDLPFFSLYKNYKNNNNKEALKKTAPDFLYKISHTNKEYNNNCNKTINLFNISKLKNEYRKKFLNFKISNKKPKLQLEIKNITPNHFKVPILSTKERHFKIINNQISLLKSVTDKIIKNYDDMIINIDSEDDQETKNINSKNILDNPLNNSNNNQINKNFQIKKINFNENLNNKRAKTDSNLNYIHNVIKKKKNYPKYYYSIQQIKLKAKKYEKKHKEAFEDLQLKVNLKEDILKKLYEDDYDRVYRPLSLGIIEPSKNLVKFKKISYKSNYLRESKIRDIIISKKLKCEFNPIDIKRVLNGKKPWKNIKDDKSQNLEKEAIN